MARKRSSSAGEVLLLARIREWDRSYYLGKHAEHDFIDDEAITRLSAEIIEIDGTYKAFVGMDLEITLVCARRFNANDRSDHPPRPLLFGILLSKKTRSLLLYLPADAYWAVPNLLSEATEPVAEIVFGKLQRGSGEIRSIWIGSNAKILRVRSATAGSSLRKNQHLI